MNHLRYALRQILNRPGLSGVVVLMLALGIGATTAMFSLFHQILLQPLPIAEPDRVVNLAAPGPKWGMNSCTSAGDCSLVFSYPMFRDLERRPDGFSGIAAHRAFTANLAFEDSTLAGTGMLVSGGYFDVLGLQPAAGRLIGPEDEPRVDEHAVVVLGYEYWQNAFGGSAAVIGDTLRVNGQPLTVIGVAPPGFTGTTLGYRAQVFVPLTMAWRMMPTFTRNEDNRRAYWVYLFARLRPDLTLAQAENSINALYGGILNELEAPLNSMMPPDTLEQFRQRRITVEPGARGQSSIPELATRPLQLLLGVSALVLLIACANIANLLLARGAARAGEMAVRASIGASRRQMMMQLLTETGLLAALGFACSLLVALATTRLIAATLPAQLATSLSVRLDPVATAFAAVLALSTMLLFGLYPAWRAARTDPGTVLKGQAGQPGGSRAAARFRDVLATAQVALSMMLLVLAGLFSYSLYNISRVDLGLQPDSVITFSVAPRLNGYDATRSTQLYDRLEEALPNLPGVNSATSSMVPLLTGSNWNNSVTVQDFESSSAANNNASVNEIGTNYFSTVGIPLLQGRDFTPADRLDTPKVAIVNQAFADKFGLEGNVLGKRMAERGGEDAALDIEIVGLAADARYSDVKSEPPPQYFLPRRQNDNLDNLYFYARTGMPPEELLPAIRDVVAKIDPALPISNLSTMTSQIQENVYMDRLVFTLSLAFAALATLLAAVGLYGLLAYSVTQRTREIGLRLALGAAPARLAAMVMLRVGRMGLVGGVLGLIGALVLGRYAEALLYGLSGYEPAVLAGAVLILAAVVFAAGYLPARRAARVEPMEALRYE